MDPRLYLLLVWAGVNGGMMYQLGQSLDWGRGLQLGMPQVTVPKPKPVDVEVAPDFSMPALDKKFLQTLERPLFVPTRRPAPPPPPPPPPPKPTMQKGQFQLLGVMLLPETSYVILKEISSGGIKRLEKGQIINGMLIQSVEKEKIVLTQYEETEDVFMKVQPSTQRNAGAVAPVSRSPAGGAAEQAVSPPKRTRFGPVVN